MFCRCRYDGSAACALTFDASGAVVCTTAQGRRKAYDFEKLFPPDTTQEEVSEDFFLQRDADRSQAHDCFNILLVRT